MSLPNNNIIYTSTAISIPKFIASRKQEYTTLMIENLNKNSNTINYTSTISLEKSFDKIMTSQTISKGYVGILLCSLPKILRYADSICASFWCPDIYWDGSHGIAPLIRHHKNISYVYTFFVYYIKTL